MVGTYPSPQSASPEGKDAVLAAEIAGNLAPVLADLAAGFVELAERRLTDEGWQEAQRADIAGRGAILFTSAVLEGETPSAAIEAAIHESRRAFMAETPAPTEAISGDQRCGGSNLMASPRATFSANAWM